MYSFVDPAIYTRSNRSVHAEVAAILCLGLNLRHERTTDKAKWFFQC